MKKANGITIIAGSLPENCWFIPATKFERPPMNMPMP
jgi:hypothetical protein